MLRIFAVVLSATLLWVVNPAGAQEDGAGPLFYEVQINGETFLLEANRLTKLESKEKPGMQYNVAVRVAPTQQKRLSSVMFEYDLPAKVEMLGRRETPSAQITHELGFSVLLGDLGRALSVPEQEEALRTLRESVVATLRENRAEEIDVTEPHERKFANSSARGETIRYRDPNGFARVSLLYVLAGPKHGATCVVNYLERDGDNVLPLVKKLLDSIRANPARR